MKSKIEVTMRCPDCGAAMVKSFSPSQVVIYPVQMGVGDQRTDETCFECHKCGSCVFSLKKVS